MGLPVKREQFKIQVDRQDLGQADTLRFNVLTFVVQENYDRAIETLNEFLNRESEYPKFRERIERYIGHSVDLVNAIRAKRNFPGIQFLTVAKQQELNERFRTHFMELQYVLKRIEKIQVDLKLDDVRSTVWVVRAVVYSVLAIVLVAFSIEVASGLAHTTHVVVDDGLDRTVNWFFDRVGLWGS